MPYKSKAAQKEAIRKAVEKHRKGITLGITEEGITEKDTKKDVIPYHPIIYALADIKKRAKLRAICQSLDNRGLLEQVSYGTRHPISMAIVNELLTAVE